jgi:hypothetical protein
MLMALRCGVSMAIQNKEWDGKSTLTKHPLAFENFAMFHEKTFTRLFPGF